MARLGPPFWPPKISPKKLMWVPFCVLFQEMRHINSFLGAQNGGIWVGAKEFTLKKFMCFFRPLGFPRFGLIHPDLSLFVLLIGREARVYRGTGVSRGVRRTTCERSLKFWELQIPCFEQFFWRGNTLGLIRMYPRFGFWYRGNIRMPEKLKKAAAVSEEKIQERSRRRGRFSSSHFPCRNLPKPWQGEHFVLPENR